MLFGGAKANCGYQRWACLKMLSATAAPQYAQAGRAGHPGWLQPCNGGPSVGCASAYKCAQLVQRRMQGGPLRTTMHLLHWHGLQLRQSLSNGVCWAPTAMLCRPWHACIGASECKQMVHMHLGLSM